jgi:Ser/Thr protein kinase RdoA (MazF antagonist)
MSKAKASEYRLRALPARQWADGLPVSGDVLGWVVERLVVLETRLAEANLSRGIIHGDYGPYNVLFRRNRPPFVVDFELARLDWRLTDLAWSLRTFAWHRGGFNWDEARDYLRAYRSVARVDDGELLFLSSVWQYLALRRFVVCLDRYCQTGEGSWLIEAARRMRSARWAERHEQEFPQLWEPRRHAS